MGRAKLEDTDEVAAPDSASLTFLTMDTRPSVGADFKPGEGGNTSVYMTRRNRTPGEQGPWSEITTATVATQESLTCAMILLKQPLVVALMIALIAIVAVILGQAYKLAWVIDWLAPILMLLFFIALCTLTTVPPKAITTRKGKVVWWARTAMLAGLMWLFISIDLVGEAPVSMRLMGLSWTMSPYGAGRLLQFGGLVLGMLACGMSWMDHRREAAAAARAQSENGHTAPASNAAPTT